MKNTKKNLLATLADENYIEQAKQLFSSVYWNAGWKGDYMLLAYKIPQKELKWFRDKGILVKKCKLFFGKKIGKFSPVVLGKFYLFTAEFKKWNNIVYLDADIIVRALLDEITKIKGFSAVQDITPLSRIKGQFKSIKLNEKLFSKIKNDYNLKKPAFNAGVLAFSTDIIKKGDFSKLKNLFNLYINFDFPEQSALNLLFYKKWKKLPRVYNIYPHLINPKKVKGIILHFTGDYKPWFPKNYFYKEWKYNLDRAELIDLNKIQNLNKKWTKKEIKRCSLYLKKMYILYYIDKFIGLVGIFLKNNFPGLYFKLKKIKKRFKLDFGIPR